MTLEEKRVQAKSDYQWYKERGICVKCHSEMAMPGKTKCKACRETSIMELRRYRAKFVDNGICWRCRTNPIVPGQQQCESCREHMKHYSREWYAARKAERNGRN
jgi:hypothetical protein